MEAFSRLNFHPFHTTHTIAKKLVADKDTKYDIAPEKICGAFAARKQLLGHSSVTRALGHWPVAPVYIEYKVRLTGVVVVVVNPHSTSVICPPRGNVDKRNRLSRGQFKCTSCEFACPRMSLRRAILPSAYRPLAIRGATFGSRKCVWYHEK